MALQGGDVLHAAAGRPARPARLGESTHGVTSVTRTINPVKGVRFSGPVVQSLIEAQTD